MYTIYLQDIFFVYFRLFWHPYCLQKFVRNSAISWSCLRMVLTSVDTQRILSETSLKHNSLKMSRLTWCKCEYNQFILVSEQYSLTSHQLPFVSNSGNCLKKNYHFLSVQMIPVLVIEFYWNTAHNQIFHIYPLSNSTRYNFNISFKCNLSFYLHIF